MHPPSPRSRCPGPPVARCGPRRAFLGAGLLGMGGVGGLSLPGLLRARAEGPAGPAPRAVIMVWKPGGCSHSDTYDPKPGAPLDYRGPFQPIATRVPG
ncbi:MAG: DUF1501 domain-containing protein, partial [Planctomycetaceae bacterium]